MSDKTSLGDRMKAYESVSQNKLQPRMPMIIRMDGRAFHTYTRGFNKPWDERLTQAMGFATQLLVHSIQGAKIAYTQSDEISVLATDYETHDTQAWFDKKVQKVCSVAASIATAAFNDSMRIQGIEKVAHFDARCFTLTKDEVNNYFIWRQQDATRNSIQALAQSHFSHKELHGVSTGQAKEKLLAEKKINWDECELWKQRGSCAYRMESEEAHSTVRIDDKIPLFTEDREYVERFL